MIARHDRICGNNHLAASKTAQRLNFAPAKLDLPIDVLPAENVRVLGDSCTEVDDELDVALSEPPLLHARPRMIGVDEIAH